jgi:hypothetical protein
MRFPRGGTPWGAPTRRLPYLYLSDAGRARPPMWPTSAPPRRGRVAPRAKARRSPLRPARGHAARDAASLACASGASAWRRICRPLARTPVSPGRATGISPDICTR